MFHTTSGRWPAMSSGVAWQPFTSSKWGKTTSRKPDYRECSPVVEQNVPSRQRQPGCLIIWCTFSEGLSQQDYCEEHPFWGSHQTSRKHVHGHRCATIIPQGCVEHWITHIADLQSFLDGGTYPTTDPCEKILDQTSESAMLHAEDPAQVLTMVDHD